MIIPGRIDTDRVCELDAGRAKRSNICIDAVNRSRSARLIGHYGRPEKFGAVAAFLASQQASCVTGSIIPAAGGFILALYGYQFEELPAGRSPASIRLG